MPFKSTFTCSRCGQSLPRDRFRIYTTGAHSLSCLACQIPNPRWHPDEALRVAIAYFWTRIDTSGGPDACHLWTGRVNKDGYGQVKFMGQPWQGAHRLAWKLTHGPIPANMRVLHKCDNPPCCNTGHHFLGTQADNVRDMHAKGRAHKSSGDAHWTRLYPAAVARGERANSAILTENQVREIRQRYIPSVVSSTMLGREFGVTHRTILLIVHRKQWAHVI